MADTDVSREAAFGQEGRITGVDRAGIWLSGHQIRRTVGSLDGKDVGDFGCGFQATYMRTVQDTVRSATLVDIASRGRTSRRSRGSFPVCSRICRIAPST